MEPIYSEVFEITDLHVDCCGRLLPSKILYMMQEVAGNHFSQLSMDYDSLARRGLFWAIIRHHIQVNRLPVSGETVTLETWPMPTTRVAYPRATVGYDKEGNVLFRTVAVWVLMNTQTRSMVLPVKSGVTVEGILRGNELALPGSLSPAKLARQVRRRVSYAELDRNLHMNNTRYLDWTDSLLSSDFHKTHPVQGFTVCYLSEALEGQDLTLHWELTKEDLLVVDAYREKPDLSVGQERVFAAQIQY